VLPAPDAALPRSDAGLAAALTDTTRRLRDAVERWSAGGGDRAAPPRRVTLLALFQQRLYRRLADDRRRADRVVARLGPEVRAEARDIVLARRALAAIPRGPSRTIPRVRTARAAPAGELRAAYVRAERRFGVPREVLAAVNFVESAFGRVRSASEAGARGPMQFLPATWRQYGLGGDIDDPGDAILGAANYLRASGRAGRPAPRAVRLQPLDELRVGDPALLAPHGGRPPDLPRVLRVAGLRAHRERLAADHGPAVRGSDRRGRPTPVSPGQDPVPGGPYARHNRRDDGVRMTRTVPSPKLLVAAGAVAVASVAYAVGSPSADGTAGGATSPARFSTVGATGATGPAGRRGDPRRDLAAAAKALGVSEARLLAALRELRPGRAAKGDRRDALVVALVRSTGASRAEVTAALQAQRPARPARGARFEALAKGSACASRSSRPPCARCDPNSAPAAGHRRPRRVPDRAGPGARRQQDEARRRARHRRSRARGARPARTRPSAGRARRRP
jgi:hypothetical protein